MKNIGYFTKILLIMVVLIIAKSSSNVNVAKVENENVNKTINLSTMALKVDEIEENIKWSAIDTYTGDLTGYGADCALCSGRLACTGLDVRDGTDTYVDDTYGEVNIVASSSNLPCGSIIRFESSRISDEPIIAIVLDRGVLGNNIDLLTPSEDYASKYVGRSSITYDVLRFGWEK